MSRRDRKYNVWIAYSDLFTNLTTFLFISALGFFAAFGSGLLAPVGVGGSTRCIAPQAASQGLVSEEGSLLKKAQSETERRSGESACTEYFSIDALRFRPRNPAALTYEHGKRATETELRERICTPIWLTLMRRDFEQSDGRITFIGIAAPRGGEAYPGCPAYRPGPRIRDLPPHIPNIETIHRCRGRDGAKAYLICPRILRCLDSQPEQRETWCRNIVAERDNYRLWAANCAKNTALSQAFSLYQACQSSPDHTTFPDNRLRSDEMVDGATDSDNRQLSWRRVRFDAIARDGIAQDLPPDHPLVTEPPGSVLVQVQYGR